MAVIGIYLWALGPDVVRTPWNPWITILPLLALVMLVWSVLGGSCERVSRGRGSRHLPRAEPRGLRRHGRDDAGDRRDRLARHRLAAAPRPAPTTAAAPRDPRHRRRARGDVGTTDLPAGARQPRQHQRAAPLLRRDQAGPHARRRSERDAARERRAPGPDRHAGDGQHPRRRAAGLGRVRDARCARRRGDRGPAPPGLGRGAALRPRRRGSRGGRVVDRADRRADLRLSRALDLGRRGGGLDRHRADVHRPPARRRACQEPRPVHSHGRPSPR